MQIKTYSFPSKDDASTRIHGMHYLPEGEPKAVVMVAHGMKEYIERYAPLAAFFCEKGVALMGHDHIGHGGSVASSDERGIMHTEHAGHVMMEDMFSDYRYMKELYPNIPCFFLGHSMGSYLLRWMLSAKAGELSGLTGAIVMGTGQAAPPLVAAGKSILRTLALIHGWNYRSESVERMMISQIAGSRFDHTGNDPANNWLTKEADVVTGYQSDEKCAFLFSLNAYMAMLDAAEYDMQKQNVEKVRKSLPIFFISGADDPVGNYGKGVREAAKMYKRVGVEHVALRLYKNDRHEILNETDRMQVYKDIYHWMKKGS